MCLGRTNTDPCPVAAVLSYMMDRGTDSGPSSGTIESMLSQGRGLPRILATSSEDRLKEILGTQFPYRGKVNSSYGSSVARLQLCN